MTKVHLTRETQCLRLTVNSNDRLWVANNLYARVLHSRYWGRNIEEVGRPNKVPFLESQFMLAASCSRKENCGHFDFRANWSCIARVSPQSWSENVERFRLHSAGSVSISFFLFFSWLRHCTARRCQLKCHRQIVLFLHLCDVTWTPADAHSDRSFTS